MATIVCIEICRKNWISYFFKRQYNSGTNAPLTNNFFIPISVQINLIIWSPVLKFKLTTSKTTLFYIYTHGRYVCCRFFFKNVISFKLLAVLTRNETSNGAHDISIHNRGSQPYTFPFIICMSTICADEASPDCR